MAVEEEPTVSAQAGEMAVGNSTVISLLRKIQSGEQEEIKQAVIELRLLAKWDMNNRKLIGEAGGIPVVASLLGSSDSKVQENAVTALLNLSIFHTNRIAIMETSGALESISEVLRAGATPESKENAAALLTSLLVVEEYRDLVGGNVTIIGSLRDLLSTGGFQGKKDAIKVLFHLALWPANRSRLAMEGIIVALLALLRSPRAGLIEDTLAVLAQIAKCREGMEAMRDSATISLIIEFLKHGSRLAKENSCSLLLVLGQTGGDRVEKELRKHRNSVVGILCTLLAVGSQRAKAKASDLMKIMVVSGSFDFKSSSSV